MFGMSKTKMFAGHLKIEYCRLVQLPFYPRPNHIPYWENIADTKQAEHFLKHACFQP